MNDITASTPFSIGPKVKDFSLESLRGIAALIVLLHHCMLGFAPDERSKLSASVFSGLINGTAAVGFFFVLSGFVLTRSFLATGHWPILTRGFVKRWPRLAGPVVLTTLASASIGILGLYHYAEVGAITGSVWLQTFARAPYVGGADPLVFAYPAALKQGLLTFFSGEAWLDTSLWTMRYEFYGSMIVFGMAALIYAFRERPLFVAYIIGLTLIGCHFADQNYVAFPVGVFIAFVVKRDAVRCPMWASIAVLVLSVYLLGYSRSSDGGAYRGLSDVLPLRITETYVHIFASFLIVTITETSGPIRAVLSGRWLGTLGEWSFPLYLIHVPVLCSAGCLAFLAAPPLWSRHFAISATIFVSLIAAYPLVLFNRAWVQSLNRFIARHSD